MLVKLGGLWGVGGGREEGGGGGVVGGDDGGAGPPIGPPVPTGGRAWQAVLVTSWTRSPRCDGGGDLCSAAGELGGGEGGAMMGGLAPL